MGFTKRWENFWGFDEDEYRNEICDMDEPRLQAEHKILKQKLLSIGAGGAASAIGGIAAPPVWILTAVNGRRLATNSRRCELVEERLAEEGWKEHSLTLGDIALGVGPCAVAELVLPASGAAVGHAVHHLTQQAAHHGIATAAVQHASEAATQQFAQTVTEEVAKSLVQHSTGDAVQAALSDMSTFVHAAAEGPQSELFVLTHGVLGHFSAQYATALPTDLAAAQAQVLGSALGQTTAVESARGLTSRGAKYGTEMVIKRTLRRGEKDVVFVTESEVSSPNDTAATFQSVVGKKDGATNVPPMGYLILALLNAHYKSKAIYDYNGSIKDHILLISPCRSDSCDCPDYDDHLQSPDTTASLGTFKCLCGHERDVHGSMSWKMPDHILQEVCDAWYPRLEHHHHNGQLKPSIFQIEHCTQCCCQDYDHSLTSKEQQCCTCRHDHAVHSHSRTLRRTNFILMAASLLFLRPGKEPSYKVQQSSSYVAKDEERRAEEMVLVEKIYGYLQGDDFDVKNMPPTAQQEAKLVRELQDKEMVLGPDHYSTLATVYNLGECYGDNDKLKQAEDMYMRALRGFEKAYGPTHKSALAVVGDLGAIYGDQGKLDLAEQMCERAARGLEKAVGPKHIYTLEAIANLGSIYAEQERTAKAEEFLSRALQDLETFHPQHSLTFSTMDSLGTLYAAQGKTELAEVLLPRAVLGLQDTLGPQHIRTITAALHSGALLAELGRLQKAEEIFLQAVRMSEVAFGKEHVWTLRAVLCLAFYYDSQGESGKARGLYRRALAGYRDADGDYRKEIDGIVESIRALK